MSRRLTAEGAAAAAVVISGKYDDGLSTFYNVASTNANYLQYIIVQHGSYY